MLLRSVLAPGASRMQCCGLHNDSAAAQRATAASTAQPCCSHSSLRRLPCILMRRQQPLVSLSGWRPCRAPTACTALRSPSDFASAPHRWCGKRRTRSRLAARLSTLDEDDPDDEDVHTEDEDDEDDEHGDAAALHGDDDEDEEDGPIVPLSIPKGSRAKALGLDDDEDLSPEESGDTREDDELLGNGGLDDLIGAGFSPDALQGILDDEPDTSGEADVEADAEPPPEPEAPAYPVPPQRSYTLGDLFQRAGLGPLAREQLSEEQLETAISDIQVHPAKVDDGCLFVCMVAESWDGHDFTECAMENGAAAFIAQRQPDHGEEHPLPEGFPVLIVDDTLAELGKLSAAFYDHPSDKLATVGITGSAGKTTTSWLVRSIFEELGQLTGMLGSIEYAIAEDRMTDDGDLWVPLEEDVTLKRDCSTPDHITPYEGKYNVMESTPNALAMHKILAGVADRGGQSAVIECTTTGLQEGRTDEVNFDVAVFTNLSSDNLHDGFGVGPPETLEEHLDIMAGLFRRLKDKDIQRAVVNVDDPYADAIKLASLEVPVVTYAIKDRDADVHAEKVKLSQWESDIIIRTPLGRLQIITPLIGRPNVYNVLAAVAVGISLNVNLKAIVAGIEAVDVVPGRTEIIDEGQSFPVIVDCANTPQALSRLLETVRDTGPRRILTVFGAEGHGDSSLRPVLGEILHYKSDFVFITNNNPRLEAPEDIVAQTTAGFPPHIHNYESLPGRPHWLRDVNAPDLGWPERAEQDAIMPSPDWSERDWRLETQGLFRRFVMEDRFSAIRVAIGTAQAKDTVVIAGKGAEDFQEYGDLETGDLIRGWFDDRVEARNALSKLPALEQNKELDRRELPWTNSPEERPERIDVLMGCNTRTFKG